MSEQPEALRLADELTRAVDLEDPEDQTVMVARWFVEDAAAELRRLHEQNERLREALGEERNALEIEMSNLLIDAPTSRYADGYADAVHECCELIRERRGRAALAKETT